MATMARTATVVVPKKVREREQASAADRAVARAERRQRKAHRTSVLRGIVVAGVIVFVVGYISAYAGAWCLGYKRCESVKRFRESTAINRSLKAEVEGLEDPGRVIAIAEQQGFVAGAGAYRVGQPRDVKVAKAE